MQRYTNPRISMLTKVFMALLFSSTVQLGLAQDFVWAPDFPVGANLPAISAQDQDGTVRSFDDLKGESGLLFMFSRSFDW
ncbi:MAG: hypothetical protein AB8B95_04695 [Pseudohongiellaceae bacterium]